MANIFADPFNSALGAAVAGTSGALSGATWAASELAKLGKSIGGTPGEISGALLGAGTGAMGGLLLGSVIGALSRRGAVNFYLEDPFGTRGVRGAANSLPPATTPSRAPRDETTPA